MVRVLREAIRSRILIWPPSRWKELTEASITLCCEYAVKQIDMTDRAIRAVRGFNVLCLMSAPKMAWERLEPGYSQPGYKTGKNSDSRNPHLVRFWVVLGNFWYAADAIGMVSRRSDDPKWDFGRTLRLPQLAPQAPWQGSVLLLLMMICFCIAYECIRYRPIGAFEATKSLIDWSVSKVCCNKVYGHVCRSTRDRAIERSAQQCYRHETYSLW
jgi:hypothetical protein